MQSHKTSSVAGLLTGHVRGCGFYIDPLVSTCGFCISKCCLCSAHFTANLLAPSQLPSWKSHVLNPHEEPSRLCMLYLSLGFRLRLRAVDDYCLCSPYFPFWSSRSVNFECSLRIRHSSKCNRLFVCFAFFCPPPPYREVREQQDPVQITAAKNTLGCSCKTRSTVYYENEMYSICEIE